MTGKLSRTRAASMSQRVRVRSSRPLVEQLERRELLNADYHNLASGNFTQNWTDPGLITANDDWANVPSILGYIGTDLTASQPVDPQTVVAFAGMPAGPVLDVIANQTVPDTVTSGGIGEFQITNPVVALQGSGTADAPFLLLHLNTTGRITVNIAYNLRDIDGSPDNAVQPVALQYRIGESGDFINLPGGFVADATTGPSLATLVTPISVTLPQAAENQAQVQVRVITTNAVGSDEWVGIDDIVVTSQGATAGALQFSAANFNANEADGQATVTVTRTGGSVGAVSAVLATSNGTAQAGSDYDTVSTTVSFADGVTVQTVTIPVTNDTDTEVDETINLALTNPTGGATLGTQNTSTATIIDNDGPGILQFSAASFSVSEGGGTATVTVSRTRASDGTVNVQFATSNGTALAGQDYTSASGTLTFGQGETSQTFTVSITGDSEVEPNETVNLTLTGPTGGATLGSPTSAVLTIQNDDRDPALVLNEIVVNPPATDQPFEFAEIRGTPNTSLSNIYFVSMEGDFESSPGTADYVRDLSSAVLGSNGLLVIKSVTGGHASAADTAVVGDPNFDTGGFGLENGSNTFLLLFSPTPILALTDFDANNDGELELPAGVVLVDAVGWTDGVGDAVYGGVSLTQSTGTPDGASRFIGNTTPLSAAAWFNGDLLGTTSDALTYNPAAASANLPAGAVLTPGAPNSFTGLLQFSAAALNTTEASGLATITVTRTGGAVGEVTVAFATSNGTALAGSDYTATSGTLTFADMVTTATFTVAIADDAADDPNETVNLTLTSPGGGATLGSPATAVLTIIDNDGAGAFDFTAASIRVSESVGLATITVTRTGGAVGAVSVQFAAAPGTAGATDFTATSGTLSFANGEASKTITVAIADDTLVELNETVNLSLTNPTGGATLGTQSTATIVIVDNDRDPALVLNELEINPPGTDQPFEFIELRGTAGVALANVYFISIEGDRDSNPGAADLVVDLSASALGSNGLLIIKSTTGGHTIPAATTIVGLPLFDIGGAGIENGANTFMLVFSPTPIVQGTDLDADNNDILELPAGAVIVDSVGYRNGDAPDLGVVYGGVDLTQTQGMFTPDGVQRFVDDTRPLTVGAWYGGDLLGNPDSLQYDPNQNFPTPFPAGALVTPGAPNSSGQGPLRVVNIGAAPSGFTLTFNKPIAADQINLYDINITTGGSLGAADVVLTGPAGVVPGSLIFDATFSSFTFVATGGVLAGGTYQVSLRSADNGFREVGGALLDGDGDGTAGGNYSNSLTVAAPAAVTVSLPDFTRGPGQPVNVPAQVTPANGIPLRLSNGAGVIAADIRIRYNPALLTITGAVLGQGLPMDAFVTANTDIPGEVRIAFGSPTMPLSAGSIDFVKLTATVPNNAPYTSKHVLDIVSLSVDGDTGAITATADDAVHVVAYFGDATANAGYSATDGTRISRVAVGLDGGFFAFQNADPLIVADINGNGLVNSTDAVRVLQEAAGIDRPEIPPPGSAPPFTLGGPDPLLNIPTTFTGNPGDTVVVPLNLDLPEGLESADLALSYDTSRLEIVSDGDIRRGSLTADFDLFLANHDALAGVIRVGLGRTAGPLPAQASGSVLLITFRIKTGAPAGGAIINLQQQIAPTTTQLNEGGLVLGPAPSNVAGDVLDGLVTVLGPAAPAVVLNEIKVNPPATDNPFEYVELRGTAGAALTNVYFVSMEGDSGGGVNGAADLVVDLSTVTLGSNGLLVIKSPSGGHTIPAATTVVTDTQFDLAGGGLENGTNSWLLIFSTTAIVETTDYDLDNDGVLELPAGAMILDAIGWSDNGAGDRVYGGVDFSTPAFTPDAATRFLNNTTPLSAAAWYFGDLAGATNDSVAYNALSASANLPPGAILTPGNPNQPASTIQLSAATYTVAENGGNATITLTRTGDTTAAALVQFATSNGTALAGQDYQAVTGTASFAVNSTTTTFTVPIINDSEGDPEETFTVTLSNPTPAGSAVLGTPTQAVVTITDDDALQPGQLQFSAGNFIVNEDGGSVTVTVTRTLGSDGAVSVQFATSNGTASGSDYTATSGTLSFAARQTSATFVVAVVNDSENEANETVNLALTSATGGATLGTPSNAVLTIRDNDAPAELLVNEVDVNPPGTDQPFEYIELRGTPGAFLSNVHVVSVEGDGGGAGLADIVFDLSNFRIGSNGLLIIKSAVGGFGIPAETTVVTTPLFDPGTAITLENGTNSFLVIYSLIPIVQAVDLDGNNDGTLEALPAGAVVRDGVGWSDGGAGDRVYGADLTQPPAPPDPVNFTPDAATRFRNDTTPLSAAAWYTGDLIGDPDSVEYDPVERSSNFPAGGMLTPGEPNAPALFLPRVERVVINESANADFRQQRSLVTNVTITFSTLVTFPTNPADAFRVALRDTGALVQLNAAVGTDASTTKTVVTLTFTGPGIINNSLADGRYLVTILGDLIRDGAGQLVDGDNNGTAGGSFLFGDESAESFYRLFGDADGDADVDPLPTQTGNDFDRIISTLLKREGDAGYLSFFDFNGDGQVDGLDYFQFNRNRGRTV